MVLDEHATRLCGSSSWFSSRPGFSDDDVWILVWINLLHVYMVGFIFAATWGDEGSALGTSWMQFHIQMDLSPKLTDATASRFLITTIPASMWLRCILKFKMYSGWFCKGYCCYQGMSTMMQGTMWLYRLQPAISRTPWTSWPMLVLHLRIQRVIVRCIDCSCPSHFTNCIFQWYGWRCCDFMDIAWTLRVTGSSWCRSSTLQALRNLKMCLLGTGFGMKFNSIGWVGFLAQVCWLCGATKGSESLDMAYTNVNDNAGWLATIDGRTPWQERPAFADVVACLWICAECWKP